MALFLNLILPEEFIDEEIPEPTANTVEEELDEGAWTGSGESEARAVRVLVVLRMLGSLQRCLSQKFDGVYGFDISLLHYDLFKRSTVSIRKAKIGGRPINQSPLKPSMLTNFQHLNFVTHPNLRFILPRRNHLHTEAWLPFGSLVNGSISFEHLQRLHGQLMSNSRISCPSGRVDIGQLAARGPAHDMVNSSTHSDDLPAILGICRRPCHCYKNQFELF